MKLCIKIIIGVIIFIVLCILYNKCFIEKFIDVERLKLTSYTDNQKLDKLMKYCHNFFIKNKIPYWVTAGTLLGCVRHKRLIPWDDDLDVCIDVKYSKKLYSLKKKLNNDGYDIIIWGGGYKIFPLNGTHIRDDIKHKFPCLDVFLNSKLGDISRYHLKWAKDIWPNEYYYNKELYPLTLYKFGNYKVYGPYNPIMFLNRAYGYDWNKVGVTGYNHKHEKNRKKIKFDIGMGVDKKPYLWVYWDNLDGKKTPNHIDLCHKTIVKHCSKSFDIVFVNKDNIKKYLPELDKLKLNFNNVCIAHKVDFYRIFLLYKYGGLYLDSDIIVLRDPIEIIKKLDEYDFVGFGCTGDVCKYGYKEPSNWILASRPYSILMDNILLKLITIFKNRKDDDKFDYFDVGKIIIWEEIDKLVRNDNYKYYHYSNKIDGTRDVNGYWVHSDRIISSEHIQYDDEKNMMFYILYNSNLPDKIKNMSKSELLNSDMNLSRFYRRALSK
jgi:phosphorylcholine metabolism protein LicD